MPQAPSDERCPYFCLIKVHNQVESNTLAEAKAFGKLLEKEFNQVAKEELKFLSQMVYLCDVTETHLDLLSPTKALLNMDVMKVIDYTYPIDQYTYEEQAKNLWEDFFGEGEEWA
eukprot:836264-Ditylum_brightwellii.AAC.1